MLFRRNRHDRVAAHPGDDTPNDPFTDEETAAVVAAEEARLVPLAHAAAAVLARDGRCRVHAAAPWAALTVRTADTEIVLGVDDQEMVRQVAAMSRLEPVTVYAVAAGAALYLTVVSPSWRYNLWALPVVVNAT